MLRVWQRNILTHKWNDMYVSEWCAVRKAKQRTQKLYQFYSFFVCWLYLVLGDNQGIYMCLCAVLLAFFFVFIFVRSLSLLFWLCLRILGCMHVVVHRLIDHNGHNIYVDEDDCHSLDDEPQANMKFDNNLLTTTNHTDFLYDYSMYISFEQLFIISFHMWLGNRSGCVSVFIFQLRYLAQASRQIS